MDTKTVTEQWRKGLELYRELASWPYKVGKLERGENAFMLQDSGHSKSHSEPAPSPSSKTSETNETKSLLVPLVSVLGHCPSLQVRLHWWQRMAEGCLENQVKALWKPITRLWLDSMSMIAISEWRQRENSGIRADECSRASKFSLEILWPWVQVSLVSLDPQQNTNETALHMGVYQNLLLSMLVEWTPIYQLFWCSPVVQGFWPITISVQSSKFLKQCLHSLDQKTPSASFSRHRSLAVHCPKLQQPCPMYLHASWNDVETSTYIYVFLL